MSDLAPRAFLAGAIALAIIATVAVVAGWPDLFVAWCAFAGCWAAWESWRDWQDSDR